MLAGVGGIPAVGLLTSSCGDLSKEGVKRIPLPHTVQPEFPIIGTNFKCPSKVQMQKNKNFGRYHSIKMKKCCYCTGKNA